MVQRKRLQIRQFDRIKRDTAQMRQERIDCLTRLLQEPPSQPLLQHLSSGDEKKEEKDSLLIEDADDSDSFFFAKSCYTCKRRYFERHSFYPLLCGPCADLNYRKRLQTADLRGKVAMVTGARIKVSLFFRLEPSRNAYLYSDVSRVHVCA